MELMFTRALMLKHKSESFNTLEKESHNMLETHVNSHCNFTIISYFYQLDVELMLHACTMIMLHLWISSIRHFTNYSCIFHNQQCQHRRIYNITKMVSELD